MATNNNNNNNNNNEDDDYNPKTQIVKISKVIIHQFSSLFPPHLIVTNTQHNSSKITNVYTKFNYNGFRAKFAAFYGSNQLIPTYY
jgi:hypothetical protein